MLKGEARVVGSEIPQLDGAVARGTGKNVGGRGVEQDVADLASMARQLGDRADIGGLVGIGV